MSNIIEFEEVDNEQNILRVGGISFACRYMVQIFRKNFRIYSI